MNTSEGTTRSARRWGRTGWAIASGALVLGMLLHSWFYLSISVPNERSRIYMSVAMVDEGTVAIDGPLARFGRIYDLAKYEGRHYSDKAPGSSLIGAVPYYVVRQFSAPEDWPIERLVQLMRRFVMVPMALAGFFVLRWLLRRQRLDPPLVDLASLGWMLATSAFHYSQAFYGHQIVAVCLLAALACVMRAEERAAGSPTSRGDAVWRTGFAALAGLLAGVAGLTEYQAGVPCVLLAAYVVAGPLRRHPGALAAFALGAAPCVAALLAYNHAAFGGPLELSYHHLADAALRERHGQGIGGVMLPSWTYFHGGILSLHRGLLATSPIFLLAPPGAVVLWRAGRRRLVLFTGLTLLYFVLFISSSNTWEAGWSYGPRLLLPAMGPAMLLVAAGMQALRGRVAGEAFVRAALVVGLLSHQIIHAFFPEPPTTAHNPLLDIAWPMARAGHHTPNVLSTRFGLDSLWSLAPLATVVALVAALFLTRGLTALGTARQRALVVGLALVLVTAAGAGIAAIGPSWDDKQQAEFMRSVKRWERGDARLDPHVVRWPPSPRE